MGQFPCPGVGLMSYCMNFISLWLFLWLPGQEAVDNFAGPEAETKFLTVDEAAQKKLMNEAYIVDLKPFVVGAVHWEWCLKAERDQVELMSQVLSKKRGACFVVDVGMNDGFYTNLAASYGCQVSSFELQPRCIKVAQQAAEKNGFTYLIKVYHQPVGALHSQSVEIQFPKDSYCDGGFTMVNGVYDANTHTRGKAPLATKKTFRSIALGKLFEMYNKTIDVIKMDVEGFEPEALLGAESLFARRQVEVAIIEISNNLLSMWSRSNSTETNNDATDPLNHPHFEIYQRIVSYGYHIKTLNCDTSPKHKNVVFQADNFEEFKRYALLPAYQKCFDIVFVKSQILV